MAMKTPTNLSPLKTDEKTKFKDLNFVQKIFVTVIWFFILMYSAIRFIIIMYLMVISLPMAWFNNMAINFRYFYLSGFDLIAYLEREKEIEAEVFFVNHHYRPHMMVVSLILFIELLWHPLAKNWHFIVEMFCTLN
jgi:hypothetical protein